MASNRRSVCHFLRTSLTALAIVSALAGLTQAAQALEWPTQPIRLIVGFIPGTSPDIIGRIVADKLGPRLGQRIVVESVPAGGGTVANAMVAKASPNSHMLLMLTASHPGTVATRKSLPYDPINDFAMVTKVVAYPMVLLTRPNSHIKSFDDLIARAKAGPGTLSWGTNTVGSIHYLLAQLISNEAGISIVSVPYPGSPPAILDLLGGRIDAMFDTATSSFARIHEGELRALALSAPTRYRLAPDIPTMNETLPGVVAMSWLGFAMAPGTSPAIIDLVNNETRAVLAMPEIETQFSRLGVMPDPSTPDEMRSQVEQEIALWTRTVEQQQIEKR